MTRDEALERVNRQLCINARITHRGDEVKICTPDEEGGTSKDYLGAQECEALAEAFRVLATELRRAA